MAGLREAGHREEDPEAAIPLFILASCPVPDRPDGAPRLWGKLSIKVIPGSLAFSIFDKPEIEEAFNCSYELNPVYQERLESARLRVSGVTEDGGARIIELPGQSFFIATGFLPRYSSEAGRPHPLITAFLEAAINPKKEKTS